MDGAQQIVIPAFVTLLCLCIVFVPMFQLGGVAGYLFRPLAEAVVFALDRLVHAVAHAGPDHGQLSHARPSCRQRPCYAGASAPPPRAGAIRSSAFSEGFDDALRARARRTTARCCCSHLAFPRPSSPASSPASSFPSACGRSSARISSRRSIPADSDARPRPARHPHRGDRAAVRSRSSRRPPAPSRPISSTTSSTISACRFPASTWPIRTPARSDRPTATP